MHVFNKQFIITNKKIIMKKILTALVLAVFAFAACNDDDDSCSPNLQHVQTGNFPSIRKVQTESQPAAPGNFHTEITETTTTK